MWSCSTFPDCTVLTTLRADRGCILAYYVLHIMLFFCSGQMLLGPSGRELCQEGMATHLFDKLFPSSSLGPMSLSPSSCLWDWCHFLHAWRFCQGPQEWWFMSLSLHDWWFMSLSLSLWLAIQVTFTVFIMNWCHAHVYTYIFIYIVCIWKLLGWLRVWHVKKSQNKKYTHNYNSLFLIQIYNQILIHTQHIYCGVDLSYVNAKTFKGGFFFKD